MNYKKYVEKALFLYLFHTIILAWGWGIAYL